MHVPNHVSVRRRLRTLARSAALGALALGALLVPAAAATADGGPVACDDSSLSQPFLPFGDSGYYKLAPAGDFEGSLTDWSLSGSAGAVSGSETAGVTGTVGASSLGLSAGDVAQSPTTCVNAAYPSFRFFARSDRSGSVIGVSVVYQSPYGQLTLPVGSVIPGRSWTPTLPIPTLASIGSMLAGGATSVALRFSQLAGSSQIDDVFVDPHTVH
jgi:hypothetical protein